MRTLSSAAHQPLRRLIDDGRVLVDDLVIPAARHLTGPGADAVLRAALDAFGGSLVQATPCHLHYRPGHDVVVRFDSVVRWPGRGSVNETLIAGATVDGAPDGTLPVSAVDSDGATINLGVWRWPFDPRVIGLADAVTPAAAAAFLGSLVAGPLDLTVLVYRPTQRAVVRAVDARGTTWYLKAMRPRDAKRLVARHDALAAAGVPVPEVVRADVDRGLIAMRELAGPTVRDRLKRGSGPLPGADEYENLYAAFASARLDRARPIDGRAASALRHGAMLASVAPAERDRLERLGAVLAPVAARAEQRRGPLVHADLYEAQLVTGTGRGRAQRITGVLDLDDVGLGDPYDDRATVLGHLIDRVLSHPRGGESRVGNYLGSLRDAFGSVIDPVELDLVTAGTLVGLATGPFRVQQPGWPREVARRLAAAELLMRAPGESSTALLTDLGNDRTKHRR